MRSLPSTGAGARWRIRWMANTLLRDAGLKVGFHMMPNLPSSTIESDTGDVRHDLYRPPVQAGLPQDLPHAGHPGLRRSRTSGSGGSIPPIREEDLVDLIAYAKSVIPEFTRLQRIQRDIPAKLIVAGSRHSNFRQLAQNRLTALGSAAGASAVGRSAGSPRSWRQICGDASTEACGGRSTSSRRSPATP